MGPVFAVALLVCTDAKVDLSLAMSAEGQVTGKTKEWAFEGKLAQTRRGDQAVTLIVDGVTWSKKPEEAQRAGNRVYLDFVKGKDGGVVVHSAGEAGLAAEECTLNPPAAKLLPPPPPRVTCTFKTVTESWLPRMKDYIEWEPAEMRKAAADACALGLTAHDEEEALARAVVDFEAARRWQRPPDAGSLDDLQVKADKLVKDCREIRSLGTNPHNIGILMLDLSDQAFCAAAARHLFAKP